MKENGLLSLAKCRIHEHALPEYPGNIRTYTCTCTCTCTYTVFTVQVEYFVPLLFNFLKFLCVFNFMVYT